MPNRILLAIEYFAKYPKAVDASKPIIKYPKDANAAPIKVGNTQSYISSYGGKR